MTEFCLQCGMEHRPVRAVGWDEDGEPACTGHSVKSKRPLTLTQGPASEPAAAPSPVQTKVEEVKSMSERICKGYKRACAELLGELNRTGLCSACYARMKYYERKPAQGGAVDIAVQPAKKAASKVPAPLRNAAEQAVSPAVLGETYEPGITLTLPASKVQRLFELLLG